MCEGNECESTMITLASVKNFFPKCKGLSKDIWSPFYAEFRNTIHSVWSSVVSKMCLNTSQLAVHNNDTLKSL